MIKDSYKINRSSIILYFLLMLGLLALNIFLLIQNITIKSSSSNREIILKEGKSVIPLAGIDINNEKQVFSWENNQRKTLLFIFSPKCGYCHDTMPIWNEIIEKIDKSKYRPIAASSFTDGTKDFAEEYKMMNIPIIVEPEPSSKIDYVMYVTPQTILMDSSGKVEKVWIGPIQNKNKFEIEQYLNLNLKTEIVSK